MWMSETQIDIKPFARLVWDRLGEAAIFGSEPESDEEDEGEEIDLALPEVNDDPTEAVTMRESIMT